MERGENVLAVAALVAELPEAAAADLRRGLCAPGGQAELRELLICLYRLPPEHRAALLLRLRRLLGPRVT